MQTPAVDDLGEQVLVEAEKACGVRPAGCPWATLRDPYVGEVIRAHRWAQWGELANRYGGRVPERVMWGVEVYDAALNSVKVRDMRDEAAERKREARERGEGG